VRTLRAVWRTGGRIAAAGALLQSAGPPARLTAQVEVHLAAGARLTSSLVNDQILAPITVSAGVAPALTLTVLDRPRGDSRWAPDVSFDLSHGDVQVDDAGAASTRTLTSLTTVAFTVGVRRVLPAGLEARAGLGALKYLPGERTGIFRDGVGLASLASIALDYAPRTFAQGRVGMSLRYDVHRFSTTALRAWGFADPRPVHRVAVMVRAQILSRAGGTHQ